MAESFPMEAAMSDPAEPERKPARKRGWKGPVLAFLAASAAGGGAYYALSTGLVALPARAPIAAEEAAPIAYVAMPPVSVPVLLGGERETLRVSAQIEVDAAQRDAVEAAMPRILDAANAYLRAIDPADLEGPSAHVRIRHQLLRRVRIIAGDEPVHDLLLTELVTI